MHCGKTPPLRDINNKVLQVIDTRSTLRGNKRQVHQVRSAPQEFGGGIGTGDAGFGSPLLLHNNQAL